MGKPAKKKHSHIPANRQSVRAMVVPTQIKGLLTRIEHNNEQHPFLIWDVSEQGLGLWSAGELIIREKIKITIGQPYPLVLDVAEVRWVEKADDGGYRCGIGIANPDKRLIALYEKFCDMIAEATSGN